MKKALITGASSGIGSVFVRELAGQGYDVTCVARNEEKLKGLTKELGDSHRYIKADLTGANDLAAICQELSVSKYNLLVPCFKSSVPNNGKITLCFLVNN